MNQCNHCKYKKLKTAGYRRHKVAVNWGMGGLNVYLIPNGVAFSTLSGEDRNKYFRAWYMALGTHCEC